MVKQPKRVYGTVGIDNYDELRHLMSAESTGQDYFGGTTFAWLREPVNLGVMYSASHPLAGSRSRYAAWR
jgi:hypothetical protein